jgi:hypothetical protein
MTRKTVYPIVKLVRRTTWVWELVRNPPAGFEEERIWQDSHYACSFPREEILKMYPQMKETKA